MRKKSWIETQKDPFYCIHEMPWIDDHDTKGKQWLIFCVPLHTLMRTAINSKLQTTKSNTFPSFAIFESQRDLLIEDKC